ncbi:DMT family transporter [Thermobifida alba]|uniref:DMT family transporter n=1 Tax=Thermobifida alba TaxID=53522 RepID=A0ABY4L586_THEAE|nr:DMT family transporter [Thermobifida alba]UPT22860.1 DMT family transporter [Thermobifida alba]
MTGAIIAAALGAVAFATGAALQERAILVSAPKTGSSQLRLLLRLVRDPVWLAGTGLSGVGTAAHVWALTQAPLTVVQPIGVSGLLCAVVASAVLHRRRLTGTEVAGCLAVTLGLVILVGMLSGHPGPRDEPSSSAVWALCAGTSAAMLGSLVLSRFVSGALRAGALALAGGISFATISALAKVIGEAALDDPLSVLRPLTLVTLVIGACGALLVQNSYRGDHFPLAYATLLISDPLMAVLVGLTLLGESLPTGVLPITAITVSTLAIVGGTVTLARSSAARGRAGKPRTAPSPAGGGPRSAPRPEEDAGRVDDRPGKHRDVRGPAPAGRSVPERLGRQGHLGVAGPAVTFVGDGDGVSGTV